ncbi:MAG TPA: flagellar basal body P-ring formation chaperone FlgA [Telluria sp.]
MPEFRCASLLLLLIAGAAQAAPPALQARLEQAAREQLERQAQALNLSEPEFAVAVVMPRAAPACSQAPAIEPIDTRSAARMRFAATCRDTPGWRYEYVVRAKVSAMVAVTAAPLAAGQMLSDADIVLERRDISAVSDAIGAPEAAVGQASRRTLRAGELLRQSHLAAPILVKRGEPVVMVARIDAIEISTAGEALDSGARGAVVRVRNVSNGRIVRMRVTEAGTVEPVELAAITR